MYKEKEFDEIKKDFRYIFTNNWKQIAVSLVSVCLSIVLLTLMVDAISGSTVLLDEGSGDGLTPTIREWTNKRLVDSTIGDFLYLSAVIILIKNVFR